MAIFLNNHFPFPSAYDNRCSYLQTNGYCDRIPTASFPTESHKGANTAPPPTCNQDAPISLVGGLSALLTQPRALGTASRGASRTGHVRCLIKGEVDEAAMFAASTFPIEPDALIERAKEVLEAGVGTKDGGACLAPDFEFCAAVVGPLGREQYLGTLGNFRVRRHPRH